MCWRHHTRLRATVKDLVEISDSIKKGLEIVPVSRMDEVLARAMTCKPKPIEWDETTTTAAPEEAAPECLETRPVPAKDGLWLNHPRHIEQARPQPSHPNQ